METKIGESLDTIAKSQVAIAATEEHPETFTDQERKKLPVLTTISITLSEADLKELIQQAKFALEEIREAKRELRK